MTVTYLSLGSDMGNRYSNLCLAEDFITERAGKIIERSPVYETEPVGFISERWFLNMVLSVETGLGPAELMESLLVIESLMGRIREGKGYTSRIIDIDILLYGNMIINEKGLEIPHPGMSRRRFVLVPLADIAPNVLHPVLNTSISDLVPLCGDNSIVRLYNNPLSAKL